MNILERLIIARVRVETIQQNLPIAALARRAAIPARRLKQLMDQNGRGGWDIKTLQHVAVALKVPAWHLLVAHPLDLVPPEYSSLMEDYLALCPKRRQIVDDALTANRLQRAKSCPQFKLSKMTKAYDTAIEHSFTKQNQKASRPNVDHI